MNAGKRTAEITISGLTVGETYVASANLIAVSHGFSITLFDTSYGIVLDGDTVNATGPYSLTFVATQTSHVIGLGARQSTAATVTVDNVSVRLADPDRSVNGKGVGVHGSLTKAPVATGADVVGYSGFNSSNYLEQPFNADLNFGAGDFCVMGWFKTSASGTDYIIQRSPDGTGVGDGFFVWVDGNGNLGFATRSGSSSFITGATDVTTGVWHHFAAVRTNSGVNLAIYLDGNIDATGTVTARTVTGVDQQLYVGVRADKANSFTGSLALLRISATAPTADQIAKIYNDEKFLFQENAKATLYGSSDAVTALAHDPVTDLLHVGTSSGRSVFQGLRRVEESTGTDSQSLAAISAVDGLVVEGK